MARTKKAATVDVNKAFDQERVETVAQVTEWNSTLDARNLAEFEARTAQFQERLANGTMRDLGGGRFQSVGGWDDGEIWTVQATQFGEMVMPQHGIDLMKDGKAKYYGRQQTWYGLGQIFPDGLSDMHEVVEQIGGPMEFRKVPALYRDPMTGNVLEIPGEFAAIWVDQDGKSGAMGTVGNRYTHVQDEHAGEFLQDLVGERVVFESAGRMQNNSKFFVGLRLTDEMVLDPEGVNDRVVKYLYLFNAHDGTGQVKCIVTPWIVRCRNTHRFALRDALATWGVRHTINWNSDQRKSEARKALSLTDQYYEQLHQEEMQLLAAKLEMDKFWEIVHGLAGDADTAGNWHEPSDEAGKRSRTIYQNRMDKLEVILGENIKLLGKNLYAAENTITEYLDWQAPRKTKSTWGTTPLEDARRGLALLGVDDDKKTRAHKQLLTLATR